jgi:hypothetical protein
MNDRTTIQLTDTTKADLDELKRADRESYESVVQMLIAHYNNSQSGEKGESRMREIAREEIMDRVVREALE